MKSLEATIQKKVDAAELQKLQILKYLNKRSLNLKKNLKERRGHQEVHRTLQKDNQDYF